MIELRTGRAEFGDLRRVHHRQGCHQHLADDRADDQVHLLLLHQAGHLTHADGRVGLRIRSHHLDLAAGDATGGVDLGATAISVPNLALSAAVAPPPVMSSSSPSLMGGAPRLE